MKLASISVMMQYLSELIHSQFEGRNPARIPEGIQVEELIDVAHRNHMDYLILGALLKSDLSEEDKPRIKSYVLESVMKSRTQLQCLEELESRFEAEGIYYQVLKGSVLKNIYPTPEMREMGDIDVMIHDKNLEAAKKVIEAMGFTLYRSVKHHDIYVKSPFLVIELHHALYDKDVDKVQYEYFGQIGHLTWVEGKKYAMQFLIEDFYVYLIAHMAKHFYETGCGIRNIVDVYYYRQRYEAIWEEAHIASELKKCGLSEFENRIRNLTQVWLGGQEADPYSIKLFDYMIDCGIYGKSENGVWGKVASEIHSNHIVNKKHLKMWYYFPPKSYMEIDYPWLSKHPYLLIIAWGIRAVHGLSSRDGRKKRRMLLDIDRDKIHTMNEIYQSMQFHFKKN